MTQTCRSFTNSTFCVYSAMKTVTVYCFAMYLFNSDRQFHWAEIAFRFIHFFLSFSLHLQPIYFSYMFRKRIVTSPSSLSHAPKLQSICMNRIWTKVSQWFSQRTHTRALTMALKRKIFIHFVVLPIAQQCRTQID